MRLCELTASTVSKAENWRDSLDIKGKAILSRRTARHRAALAQLFRSFSKAISN